MAQRPFLLDEALTINKLSTSCHQSDAQTHGHLACLPWPYAAIVPYVQTLTCFPYRDPAVAVSETEEGAGRGTLALVGDLAHSAAASAATLARDAVLGRPGGYRAGAPCLLLSRTRSPGRAAACESPSTRAGASCGQCPPNRRPPQ